MVAAILNQGREGIEKDGKKRIVGKSSTCLKNDHAVTTILCFPGAILRSREGVRSLWGRRISWRNFKRNNFWGLNWGRGFRRRSPGSSAISGRAGVLKEMWRARGSQACLATLLICFL